MATVTWIGGQSIHADKNDATDLLNWVGGLAPLDGDTVILPAGTGLAPVALDLIGQPGTAQTITSNLIQVSGPFDTLTLSNVVMNTSSIVAGDGVAAGQGFVLNLTDSTVTDSGFSVGNNATLNLTGSTSSSLQLTKSTQGPSVATQIRTTGTATNLVINTVGTANVDVPVFLVSPGGHTTINIAQSGTLAGFLNMNGALIDAGGTLSINGDSNTGTRFSNTGFFLIDGTTTGALATLSARMNGIAGGIQILGDTGGATLDLATNMPGSQIITWGDGNGVLKIEASTVLASNFNVVPVGQTASIATTALQNFFGRNAGFQAGDTIILNGVSPSGLTYSFGNDPNFGVDVLTINRGTAEVARLRFSGENLVDGTGTVDGAASGNFALVSQGTTAVAITLANTVNVSTGLGTVAVNGTLAHWNGVINGATTDWGAANWTGGTAGGLPGIFQSALFALTPGQGNAILAGNLTPYVVTVSTAETAGSLVFDDPLAQMLVSAPLTLSKVPGQSNGGGMVIGQGQVEIATGGTVTTSRLLESGQGNLQIDVGGQLLVGGNPGFVPGGGLAGVDIEAFGNVAGGTIVSGGNMVVGNSAGASFDVTNNVVSQVGTVTTFGTIGSAVTATYTQVGGSPVLGATNGNQANLFISGPNTTWSDVGGDASTPFSGAMVVGGGQPSLNGLDQIVVSTGSGPGASGNGSVFIDNGATVTEQSYAILGLTRSSSGTVTVNNGAHWNIGTGTIQPTGSIVVGNTIVGTNTLFSGTLPTLAVGSGGTGTLNVTGGVVQLGTLEQFNTAKMVIGVGNSGNNGATGVVQVQGNGIGTTALLDTGGGPLIVGQRSNGVLTVNSGGTVSVGDGGTVLDPNSAPTTFAFGLGIGNRSGTVGAIAGIVNVFNGGLITDHGNIVVGRDSTGLLSISGGTVDATGALYMGGQFATNNGTVAITPTLVKGAGGNGTLSVAGGGTFTARGGIADLFQGSTISLNGSSQILIGGGTSPVAGELVVAPGATLQGAGLISVVSGDSTLRNSGTVIAGGLTSGGVAAQNNTTLELNAVLAGSGVFAISPGAALQIDTGGSIQARVDFGTTNFGTVSASNEVLRLLQPTSFHGTVDHLFGNNNRIDFIGAGFLGGNPTSYTPDADPTAGGALTVNTASGTVSFRVSGFHPNGFVATVDGGSSGTVVFANDAAPCFLAGTAILTAGGERAVEALRVGDLVPAYHGGALRRVVWTGQTRIDLDRHPEPGKVAPVRVVADAFAPGVPHRDLVVSPDHALWTGGALVPAYLLVNGATIRREKAAGVITYVHVELDAHDIVLAEGLPAESYLDTGNRGLFAGEAGARPVHADLMADLSARGWDERACAMLALGGAEVAEAHGRLAARAAALGHGLSADAAPVVEADGRVLDAVVSGGRIVVSVPAGVREVRLLSRVSVPCEIDADCDDRRRLGLAVAGMWLDGVALDGAVCAGGFYPAEAADLRWTDGAGRLVLPAAAGPRRLEIALRRGLLRYWGAPDVQTGRTRQVRPV